MVRKSTHLQVIPQQGTQKHSKFAITDTQEKPADLYYCTTRTSTNFANLGSFAKVAVSVESITL